MATPRRGRSCPICCEVPGGMARALPCGHAFCLGCILRWLRGTRTCPLCRTLISTVSFSEKEQDCLQCIIRHPGRAGHSDGRGPEAPSPASAPQGAAGAEAVGGILPELWAELFRRRRSLLNPVRSWLRQWLQMLYRERWWQVKTAESSVLLALCIFGPDEAVLVQRLQPRLQHHTAPLVRGVLGIIEARCSEELRRLRGQAGSPGAGAGAGPSACPGDGAASAGAEPSAEHEASSADGAPGSADGAPGSADGAPEGRPGPAAPVLSQPEQP